MFVLQVSFEISALCKFRLADVTSDPLSAGGVCQRVATQATFPPEALAAHATGKGRLLAMHQQVSLVLVVPDESTAALVADEGTLVLMELLVTEQRGLLLERLAAGLADVTSLLRVNCQVLVPGEGVGEGAIALEAGEDFFAQMMTFHVSLQIRRGLVVRAAVLAGERALLRVYVQVCLEIVIGRQVLVAYVALAECLTVNHHFAVLFLLVVKVTATKRFTHKIKLKGFLF